MMLLNGGVIGRELGEEDGPLMNGIGVVLWKFKVCGYFACVVCLWSTWLPGILRGQEELDLL